MRVDAAFAVQFALGAVFLLSVASKLRDPVSFARGVLNYQILSPSLTYYAAGLIIVLESFLAASHIANRFINFASLLGLCLLLTFLFVVSINLIKKRRIPCHCFGNSSEEIISTKTILRLLLALIGEAIVFSTHFLFHRQQLDDALWSMSLAKVLGSWSWALFVLTAAMWVLALQDVVDLLMRQPRGPRERTVN
jgi:hypothetical protein